MENKEIQKALTSKFEEDEQRIVFWNDPEKEFAVTLSTIQLPKGVKLLRLDQIAVLEAKILIEQDDPEGRYLLYSPKEEPDYEDDWLLDIRLYSKQFYADRPTIILTQLGLANQHLREHLALRLKFFDHKQRLQKLKPLLAPNDTDLDLDLKMIAVLVKADQPLPRSMQ